MKKTNKLKLCVLVCAIFCSLSISSLALDSGVFFGPDNFDLTYTGNSGSVESFYGDGVNPNNDASLALCGVSSSSYAGLVYGFNDDGVWDYSLISYGSGTNSLSNVNTPSGPCYTTTGADFTVSPSYQVSRDPDIFMAAFPGRPLLINSSDATATAPNFITQNTTLRGSYGLTYVYNQVSDQLNITDLDITFIGSSSILKDSTDSDFGISNSRRLAIALCTDEYGASCSDGEMLTTGVSVANNVVLDSDVVSNDLSTFNRNIVVNGLDYPFCIGPDLRITNIDTNGPVYAGQETTIDITIENNGNVDVNTDFEISLNQTDADAVETIVLPASFSQIAYDDFETDFGHWDNSEGIGCEEIHAWGSRRNTTTPSSVSSHDTGPAEGVGGPSDYFIYVETSSSGNGCYYSEDQALVYFNKSIDYDLFDARIEFYFHAYGAEIDSLYLEENSTGSWMSVWEIHDINNDYWNKTVVELSSLSGVGSLRFNYTRDTNGFYSDIALDQINVSVRESSKITTNLPLSSSTTISVNVTPDTGTGLYEYDAGLILDSIADCDEGNNDDLGTLTVENVCSATININGQETVHFDEAAHPYNFSIQIVDADGFQPSNITVIVSETNGLNIMAPLQWYEGDTRSLGSISQARFLTNDTGYAAVSLIPTGDKVYTNLIDSGKDNSFIGNYSLTLELFDQDGNQLPVLYDGVIYQSLPMYVDDNSYPDVPFGGPPEATDTFNNNVYLELSRDYLQRVWGWMNKYLAVS